MLAFIAAMFSSALASASPNSFVCKSTLYGQEVELAFNQSPFMVSIIRNGKVSGYWDEDNRCGTTVDQNEKEQTGCNVEDQSQGDFVGKTFGCFNLDNPQSYYISGNLGASMRSGTGTFNCQGNHFNLKSCQ